MKFGELDIIGDGGNNLLRLLIRKSYGSETISVVIDNVQTEHLITYLKGLRDGLGWNNKAAAYNGPTSPAKRSL